MSSVKAWAYTVNWLALLPVVVLVGFGVWLNTELGFTLLVAVAFCWPASPYILLFGLIKFSRSIEAIRTSLVLVLITAVFGYAVYFYAFILNPDAQSAVAFMYVPLWQCAGLLVVAGPVLLLNRTGHIPEGQHKDGDQSTVFTS